ncbi:MAG TPA: hypothetical protein VKB80_17570 [Kofleriaceae bacterium]|nr:hypothetical protein [Kofleriaceae bacterium]
MTARMTARAAWPAAAALALAGAAALALAGRAALAGPRRAPPAHPAAARPAPGPEAVAAGRRAFADVARVLQSPRCRNCHPRGDAPLQTDAGRPHRMNITRLSAEAGLPCGACHQERNAETLGIRGGPPGAPKWGLPPAATPMVFEGKTRTALCEQLRDPARNGKRTLEQLLEHVSSDPLVLWGWNPGGRRTVPPLSHRAFVASFRTWVDSGGACP